MTNDSTAIGIPVRSIESLDGVSSKPNDSDVLSIAKYKQSRQSHDAEFSWASLCSPLLEAVLTENRHYSAEQRRLQMRFFIETVIPWLGPNPRSDDSDRLHNWYNSVLTDDHTPIELSFCWRHEAQAGDPIIRYVVDIAPSPKDVSRMSSLAKASQAIEDLSKASNEIQGLTIDTFPELWRTITNILLHNERTQHQSCSKCSPSSTFIGFDLEGSKLKAKMYWILPSCQSFMQSMDLMEHLVGSCETTGNNPESSDLTSQWKQIRTHMENESPVLFPRMLSIDATRHPAPRIKIYTRCSLDGATNFDSWKRHLILGGRIRHPGDFMDTCERLWTATTTVTTQHSKPPRYHLVLYDLGEKLSSKLYMMCPEIHRPDNFIARQLRACCKTAQKAPVLSQFQSISENTAFISEIGLAPRATFTEMSIYVNPSFFSHHLWRNWKQAPDYLEKVRGI